MIPVDFEGSNKLYGPPEGWTDYECMTIHAMEYEHKQEGKPDQLFVITAWMPSKEDMEAFSLGRPLMLQVFGGQPPVCLYTIDAEGKPNI